MYYLIIIHKLFIHSYFHQCVLYNIDLILIYLIIWKLMEHKYKKRSLKSEIDYKYKFLLMRIII